MTLQEALTKLRDGLNGRQAMERKLRVDDTYILPEIECLDVIEKALEMPEEVKEAIERLSSCIDIMYDENHITWKLRKEDIFLITFSLAVQQARIAALEREVRIRDEAMRITLHSRSSCAVCKSTFPLCLDNPFFHCPTDEDKIKSALEAAEKEEA